ncbi:thiamine pyrophosphate-binding protein [Methanobacterium paludis]|uniref:Acetolactate synthase n=1 Tax=Methanobacterium paludis (strain DSM 25820 / JCM 18151 / SWAN1) TaxID=868131 RepID=F6D4X6_METPW|nr:thiamine pyrophosphate-binding protein [Methanobacterium paludis]AEG18847.1 Acetolactate synthase [Methanobacterium paludis]
MKTKKIRCADALVEILKANGVKFVFGHPGEQILPFYDALRTSKIKHVLMRHEQGAAHAADGYARSSGQMGVCLSTAGPGALNLVMGVATAYKDSVPILVITGDVPTDLKGGNVFQEIDICGVFQPITLKSFDVKDSEEAVFKLKEAIEMMQYGKTGPVHLNLPKDVLLAMVDISVITENIGHFPEIDKENISADISNAIKLIKESERPFIIAGAGIIWADALMEFRKFVETYGIPVATTYPARGIIPEGHQLSLGMIGVRGTEAANFAGKNCDVLIALGCRLSERTRKGIGNCKVIHVNLDEKSLNGNINIQEDVLEFIRRLNDLKLRSTESWLLEIQKYSRSYCIKTDYLTVPLKPQRAIKEILDASEINSIDSVIINDAGTHTTWVTLLKTVKNPSSLLFSGGFGPMGYAVPASVGAAVANPGKHIVAVVGDGGFQMTLQELATIAQLDLPVVVCIINNSSLGIIKQWQDLYYEGRYEVELENPDFVKLAEAYNIVARRVDSPGSVFKAVKKALDTKKPYLIEVVVDKEEGIPLPR